MFLFIYSRESIGESVELQVDYWLSGSSAVAAAARENQASAAGGAIGLAATVAQAVKRETKSIPTEPSSVKYTVKAGFRWIVVQRLPNGSSFNASSSDSSSLFTMTFGLKEKKQKSTRTLSLIFYFILTPCIELVINFLILLFYRTQS